MNQEELATVLTKILTTLTYATKEGVNILDLERLSQEGIENYGVESINKGYISDVDPKKPSFPSVVCIGVNTVISHGVPTNYVIRNGDFVSIDMGIRKDGVCADAALTIGVGELTNADERLLRYAKGALYYAITLIEPGADVVNIGRQVEQWVGRRGYVTNRVFYGHGIGQQMHEDPVIPSFDVRDVPKYPDIHYALKEGDVLCLEPFLTKKDEYGMVLSDGWTTVTRDGSRSAFFEHMVKVTKEGCKILTDHIPYL